MAKNIIIYIPDTTLDHVIWLICDEKGNPVSSPREGTLAEVASKVEGRKISVVMSAALVTMVSAKVAGNRSKAVKAIPFALEELLSDDVEELHFAIGDRQAEDSYPVAVVAHEVMQSLQQRFVEVGLRPIEMRPASLALPRFKDRSNAWTAFLDDKHIIVRLDDYTGYTVEAQSADFLLEQTIKQSGENKPAGMVLFSQSNQQLALEEDTLNIEYRGCEDAISLFASGIQNTVGINLLQGDYSYKQQFDKAWKPWRPAVSLLAVMVLIFGLGKFIENQQLSRQIDSQKIEMEKILKRTFPNIRRIVNPKKQMKSALKKLGATGVDSGFVSVMNEIGEALQLAGNTNLNSISYKSGRLDLDFDTDQLSTLDKLKQQLENEGKFSMKIESANQSKGRIRGRVRVEIRG